MSSVIESLKVRNFEGYKDETFPFSAGLNLIKGRNSTGKSTVLDAVSFALYGEAPEVEKKLLVSRLPGCNDVTAYVKFKSPRTGQIVEVKREGKLDARGGYRKESLELKINGEDITFEDEDDFRARITKLLGVSFRQFMNLVYVRQGRLTAILDPKPEQMDSILGITLLRELHEQFDETRKHLEKYEGNDIPTEVNKIQTIIIPQYDRTLTNLAGEIPTLQGEVGELEKSVKKGESRELQTLLKQIEERRTIDSKLQDLTSRTQQLLQSAGAKTLDEVKKKQAACAKRHETLKRQTEKQTKIRDQLQETWSDVKGKAKALADEIDEHQGLLERGIAKCPTCGQVISPSKLRTQLRADRARLTKLQAQAKQSKGRYDEADRKVSDLDDRRREARDTAKTLKQTAETIADYETQKNQTTKNLETKLREIRKVLKALNLELNPQEPTFERNLAGQIPVSQTELNRAQTELTKKAQLLKEKQATQEETTEKKAQDETKLKKLKVRLKKASLARQLSEGFDQAIEERRRNQLKSIEVRALQYYKSMTDQHTYSAIHIDPEAYRVHVSPKGLTGRIPATRTGGGHQTLISLALRLALLHELGSKSLLILDEPTYGVDDQNLPQLASQLGQASKQLSQTIIVTHHGICEEDATNILNVIVGEDGVSRIERTQ
ncbi:MAG: AAA family ATPase [Candidatus Bathyarchaeia archaeon]|jgi:exonuclease SbcC